MACTDCHLMIVNVTDVLMFVRSSFVIEDDHDSYSVRSAEWAMSAEVAEESNPSTTVFPAGRTRVLGAKSRNASGSGFSRSTFLLHFVQSSGLCTVSSTGNF